MRPSKILALITLILPLAGCGATPPSLTPSPSATSRPTRTPAPIPTATPLTYPMRLEQVGQFGGSAIGLALRADTAYSIVGPRIVAFDISNPYNPVMTGRSEIMEDWLRGLAVVDHYVITGGRSGTLWVLDVSSPGDPVLITKFDAEDDIAHVVAAGHMAYLALWESGLLILDLADPAAPKIAGRLATARSRGDEMIISGNLIFLGTSPIDIIDISDPANPRKLSEIVSKGGEYEALAVSGTTVYAGSNVYDITDPAAPQLIGHGGNYSDGVVAIGHLVFGLSGQVYDFSDPDNPVLVGRPLQLRDNPEAYGDHVAVRGHFLYRAGWGIQIYDLSAPPTQNTVPDFNEDPVHTYNWSRIGFLRTDVASIYNGCCGSGFSGDLRVVDHYLYTASVDGDFVWDISDPVNPVLVRSLERPSVFSTSVQTSKGLIYRRVYGDEGFYLFLDTQNPESSTFTKVPDDWGTGYVLGAVGDTLVFYAARGTATDPQPDELRLYDVSSPEHPVLVGSFSPLSETPHYGLAGDYVIGRTGSLEDPPTIVNISDPTHPRLVDPKSIALPPARFMSDDQWIYAVAAGELRIYPRGDLSAPLSVFQLPPEWGERYDDGFIWLKGDSGGGPDYTLTMVDVRDPAHPSLFARTWLDGYNVAVYGDIVYVEVPLSGVYIFRLVPNQGR